MSTAVIVGIIATGLVILVTTAVIMQTVEKNLKEKRRVHAALLARARSFQYMLSGFPDGFLNRDLQILVCKCLVQVYEQLSQHEPKNPDHTTRLQATKQQIQQLANKSSSTNQRVTLTDTQQIQEVQKLLNTLFNFIAKLIENRNLTVKEGKVYAGLIRRLMVQSSVDALAVARGQALQEGKDRLAIHYLQMAIDKMNKENSDDYFSRAIAKYTELINELNTHALEKEQRADEEKQKLAQKWEDMDQSSDTWKKKALYD